MKKLLILLALISSIFLGCQKEEVTEDISSAYKTYTLFTINTHDWVLADESIKTLNRVIDIHEEHEIPVQIYLTDPMIHLYTEKSPALIERLKTSPYVVISYHVRPPAPYYLNFDISDLNKQSEEEIYDTIMEYETHKLDLETGEALDVQGGYEYAKELFGYAPPVVGTASNSPTVTQIMTKVYKELGATFAVVHGKESNLGDKKFDLYVRPEHIEIKLYEYKDENHTAKEVIEERLANLTGNENHDIFMNIKFHENNFYSDGTPWDNIYFKDGDKSKIKLPPYNLDEAKPEIKSEELQARMWKIYEDAVIYVKENSATLNPISEFDLQDML